MRTTQNNIQIFLVIAFLLIISFSPVFVVGDDEDFIPYDDGISLIERGDSWNLYYNSSSGEYTLSSYSGAINYKNDVDEYVPINTTIEILPQNHPARKHGYVAGNEKGLFSTYFKQNAQSEYPVCFTYTNQDMTYDLRSKLLGIGYYDPSSNHDYTILQTVQDVNGAIVDNGGVYSNILSGIDAEWVCEKNGLKENIIVSNTTKTLLQNNPPSNYGYSSQDSYVVFVTKLDYKNVYSYNGTINVTGNFTFSGDITFKDVNGGDVFTLADGYAYERNNEANTENLIYRLIQYNDEYYLLSGMKATTLNSMEFPVVFDPTYQYGGHDSDGWVVSSWGPWNTVRSASTGNFNSTISLAYSSAIYVAETNKAANSYCIRRVFMGFDTSNLSDTCDITGASLFVKGHISNDCRVMAQNWTGGSDGIDNSDYNDLRLNDGIYGTNSWTAGSYNQISFNACGIANVSKTGWTYIALRSYDYDYLDSPHPDDTSSSSGIHFNESAGNEPYLNITFTASGNPPTITNPGPPHHQEYTDLNPTLNATIWDIDGNDTTVDWYYQVFGDVAVSHHATFTNHPANTSNSTTASFANSCATLYTWNLNANDTIHNTTSSTWEFVTTPYNNVSNYWNDSFNNKGAYVSSANNVTLNNGNANATAGITTSWSDVDNTSYCDIDKLYCTHMGITNVKFAELDKSSGYDDSYYNDFTTTGTNLTAGQSYYCNVSIQGTNSAFKQRVTVFIDWNGDEDLTDSGEYFYLGESASGQNSWVNSSIAVPSSVRTNRPFLMRVISAYYGWGEEKDPCENANNSNNYGDIEDYSIGINSLIKSNITSANIIKESGTTWNRLNVDINNTANSTFSILDQNGTVQLSGLDGQNSDISSVTNATIQMFGEFNATLSMYSWQVSWSGANNAPTQSTHKVLDSGTNHTLNDTNVLVPPTSFWVTINDTDDDKMNITIMENSSGWKTVNQTTGNGLDNGTYSFTNVSWITNYDTTYYVSFNVTDGTDWCNETYHFTTRSIDEIFGLTTIGASNGIKDENYIYGSNFTSTSLGSYAISITMYSNYSIPAEIYFAIYDDDSGPDNLIVESLEYKIHIANAKWRTYIFEHVQLNADTTYWLCFLPDSRGRLYYDTVSNGGFSVSRSFSDGFPSTITGESLNNERYSIYCRANKDNASTTYNHVPVNGSEHIRCHSDLSALFQSLDFPVDVNWWSNYSGSWSIFATNSSLNSNQSITQMNPFESYSTEYYWKVETDNGVYRRNSSTLHFTTHTVTPNVSIEDAGCDNLLGSPYRGDVDTSGDYVTYASDGYYVNSSHNNNSFMNITVRVYTAYNITTAKLHWYNKDTEIWDNTSDMDIENYPYYTNITYNKTGLSHGNYSFDVYIVDKNSTAVTRQWNKLLYDLSEGRRYVELGTELTDVLSHYNLYMRNYSFEYVHSEEDTLPHDGGPDGTATDTGRLTKTSPTSIVEERTCLGYVGYWFEEDVALQSTTIDSIYVSLWWRREVGTAMNISVGYTTGSLIYSSVCPKMINTTTTEAVDTDTYEANTIYHTCGLLNISEYNYIVDTNNIYNYFIGTANLGPESTPTPHTYCNETWRSFVIFNPYNNDTLNVTDSDGDGYNDYDEMFVYYSDPFLSNATAVTVIINFAGNLSDSGGPYWRPPGETDILDEAGEGDWQDGYYANDSRQSEGWIYINCTITGATTVYLDWLNGTTWTRGTYALVNTAGDYWEINTSGNITTCEGYDYSFDINATGIAGNNITWWNKTCIGGATAICRRSVQLNCTPENINYSIHYMFTCNYTTGMGDGQFKKDRMVHDQGWDGGPDDSGYFRNDTPNDFVNDIHCTSYVVGWFDTSVCAEPFTLDNVYYHIWNSISDDTIDRMGFDKERDDPDWTGTDDFYSSTYAEGKSFLQLDPGYSASYSTNYSLNARLLEDVAPPYSFTDNDIYELNFKLYSGTGTVILSNRSYTSFVILNVPDNATLDASHNDTDNDGLWDRQELYSTYTNPFLADTDNDGVSDYDENLCGSDPNNYTDYMSIENYEPANGATSTDINPELQVYANFSSNYSDVNITFMGKESGGSYYYLGYVRNASSGVLVNFTWVGRKEEQEYEWYAIVSSGNSSSTTFTTRSYTNDWIEYGNQYERFGFGEVDNPPMTNNTRWVVNCTGNYDQFNTPVIYDGIVYVCGKDADQDGGGHENLTAIWLSNGTIKYQVAVGSVDDSVAYHDGYLYISNGYESTGNEKMQCRWASNGTEKWSFTFPSNFTTGGAPTVNESLNSVFVVASSMTGTSSWANLYSFNISTGAENWNTSITWNSLRGNTISPTYNDGNVYCAGHQYSSSGWQYLYCINATTGSTVWDTSVSTDEYFWDSSPVIHDNLLYIGDSDGVNCFDKLNGTQYWHWQDPDNDNIFSTPVYWNNTLYVGGDGGGSGGVPDGAGKFYALNASIDTMSVNDRIRWSYTNLKGDIYSLPAIANSGSQPVVYFSSHDINNSFVCLNAENGTQVWNYSIYHNLGNNTKKGTASYGSFALSDECAVVCADDWNVYCFGTIDWWNTSFGYSKLVTVGADCVDETLTDFPVLVHRNADSNLSSHAQSDGGDIVFVSYDNTTQYKHEIESYSSGTLWAWVKIPTLSSSSDTRFWMYYGNNTVSNQEDVSNTWDEHFGGVYHLSATTANDSAWKNANATVASGTPTVETGKMYNAIGFNSSINQERLELGVAASGISLSDLDTFTIEYWVYLDNCTTEVDENRCLFTQSQTSCSWNILFGITHYADFDNKRFKFVHRDDDATGHNGGSGRDVLNSSFIPSGGYWQYWAGVYNNGASDNKSIYYNGTLDSYETRPTIDNPRGSATTTSLGYACDFGYFEGKVDELRISRVVRNDSWIKATYQISNQACSTYGSENSNSPWSNSIPTTNLDSPANSATGISRQPTCQIDASDMDISNQSINVTWQFYDVDHWYNFGYNQSSSNMVDIQQTLLNASAYNTTYQWRVVVHDNATPPGYATNVTWNFTTELLDYYVNTSGLDSNVGSETSPFLTIQKAVNETQAGGTTYIMKGDYNEQVSLKNNGTSGNWINITNYQNDTVSINGSGLSIGWIDGGNGVVNIWNYSYVNISNLKVCNSTRDGVSIKGEYVNDITLWNLTLDNTTHGGVHTGMGYTTDAMHERILVSNCTFNNTCQVGAEAFSSSYLEDSDVCYNLFNDTNVRETIDIQYMANNTRIHHNTIYTRNDTDSNNIGIYFDGWNGNITNCSIYCNTIQGGGYGIYINAELQGAVNNITIYNNIIKNVRYGFVIGGDDTGCSNWTNDRENITFANNICYDIGASNGTNSGNVIHISAYECNVYNLVIINNILTKYNGYYGMIYSSHTNLSNFTCDYNYLNVSVDDPSYYAGGAHSIIVNDGDPLFANPSADEFWLQSSSSCIDEGTSTGAPSTDYNGTSRPVGLNYDIGAYETTKSATSGTESIRVSANSDDAEENTDDDSMSLESSDLELLYDSNMQAVGMRFLYVDIPQGATITDAYMNITDDDGEADGSSAINMTIYGHDVNNSWTFTTSTSNITGRTKTTNYSWWNTTSWSSGEIVQTTDIKDIIQEIIDRPGWSSGNSITIIITTPDSLSTKARIADSYDGDSLDAPQLVINWTSEGVSVEVAPTEWDFGLLNLGESGVQNFTLWQNGTYTIDIEMGIDNVTGRVNFTYVSYTTWSGSGNEQFSVNHTNDTWANEYNVLPSPTNVTLVASLAPGSTPWNFGVRVFAPRLMSVETKDEDFMVVLNIVQST